MCGAKNSIQRVNFPWSDERPMTKTCHQRDGNFYCASGRWSHFLGGLFASNWKDLLLMLDKYAGITRMAGLA
jgi:hypothetical protein